MNDKQRRFIRDWLLLVSLHPFWQTNVCNRIILNQPNKDRMRKQFSLQSVMENYRGMTFSFPIVLLKWPKRGYAMMKSIRKFIFESVRGYNPATFQVKYNRNASPYKKKTNSKNQKCGILTVTKTVTSFSHFGGNGKLCKHIFLSVLKIY
jgi:hypothetical protein